ncbi:MAG TPA: NAD(P)H-dependent oxidoreductase, partial [Candidatus Synoicihabitans sp.]|nr:NAD(P)H-dependent oxidoreductase [Candidatus Synoicihabitans sp.]
MTTISPDHPTSAGFFDRKTARPARRITVLAGTNRPGSATRQIAGILVAHYVALQQEVNILDLAELPLEAFAPSAYARKPDSLYPFFQSVLNADGLHVVTPEYNGGPPGALKYFIDLLPYPEAFADRAVCFTGLAAGKWG